MKGVMFVMRRNFIKHPSNIAASHLVQAAHNYGGAFDVDPEMFFTRDDLDEMAEEVVNHVQESVPGDCSLSDAWIGGPNNQTVHVEVDWSETGSTYTSEVIIDMRKIRKSSDLRDKYALTVAGNIIQQMRADAESYELNGVGIEGAVNTSASTAEALQNKIFTAVVETMQGYEFGFTAEEAKQYSRVTLEDVDNSTRIEVGVEVSYDGMELIAEVINPIVQEVDPDAYFDFDEPGIMSAYVDNKYLQ